MNSTDQFEHIANAFREAVVFQWQVHDWKMQAKESSDPLVGGLLKALEASEAEVKRLELDKESMRRGHCCCNERGKFG